MDYPPPFNILEMAFFTGADETDWRYVAFAPVIEYEPSPALGIEILPTHQSPAPDDPGPGINGFLAQSLWSLDKSGNIVRGDRNWPLVPKLGNP
jgi:hypothetical protein